MPTMHASLHCTQGGWGEASNHKLRHAWGLCMHHQNWVLHGGSEMICEWRKMSIIAVVAAHGHNVAWLGTGPKPPTQPPALPMCQWCNQCPPHACSHAATLSTQAHPPPATSHSALCAHNALKAPLSPSSPSPAPQFTAAPQAARGAHDAWAGRVHRPGHPESHCETSQRDGGWVRCQGGDGDIPHPGP